MKYMLDTNTCIFIMSRKPGALAAFQQNGADGVAVSAITLAELEYGISKSSRREENRNTLEAFLALVIILPFDGTAAAEYGELRVNLQRKGTPIGMMDMLIAAHALAADLILVTNNTREFERIEPLKLEDWLNQNATPPPCQ